MEDESPVFHAKGKEAPDLAFRSLPQRYNLIQQTNPAGDSRHYSYRCHLLISYSSYGGFKHSLEWISLAALRERWSGMLFDECQLNERHPITLENSYQARATATLTSDGKDQVSLAYVDENTTRVTESGGAILEYTFDENWLATKVMRLSSAGSPATLLGRREWDSDGMLLAETDALGNTMRYRYDAKGNLTVSTDPNGHATRIDYDTQNRPVEIINAVGHITRYSYDAVGNLLTTTDALGHTTSYRYDEHGRLVALIDAKGGEKSFAYNRAGHLRSSTDCSGYRSYYRYDSDGQLATFLNALEEETSYTYDQLGRITAVTQPDKTQEQFVYDAEGDLLTHTDAMGYQTHYRYNGHGLPVERIDALGQTLQYRYDEALQLVELINGNGESYHFVYNAEGWLISETGFDGKITSYTYDRAGRLISSECCGQRTDLIRDVLGQLEAKSTADGIVRYNYDALGQLIAVAAPHAEQKLHYDPLGNLLEEHSTYYLTQRVAEDGTRIPDHVFVMTYVYDELSNRIQSILPDGHRIDILRYGSGHWHGVLWDGETVVDVERDRLHREKFRYIGKRQENLTATRSYDLQSRVTAMTLRHQMGSKEIRPLRERSLSYDPNCLVPCDHIPRRSWPLFRAKAMLDELIADLAPRSPNQHQTAPEPSRT